MCELEKYFTNKNLHAIIAQRTSRMGESVCKLHKYTWRPTNCDMKDEYYKQKNIIMILLQTKGLIKG